MKRLILICLSLVLLSPLSVLAGGLDSFLASLNVQARADLPGFSARIGAQFGVPVPQVQAVIRSVPEPADAFMIYELGRMSGRQPDQVMAVYQPNRNKGWGAIAKELGIKPGSREFHDLKAGNLSFSGHPEGGEGGGDGKGKGKGHKGHGRGHNK
ncbi:hypothetical protein GPEL0_01r3359 [Geoanaerobacter pelophilus]|uniref:Uncharacterized protein n=1 Tax=Geoanaerobacter pelophilus TaxID=60036 RepID=A0ABQ0MKA1_9BACT|nr:hypothetical protein [Geoanaerobacter pelophilus]GAW67503.1 hypothetical protein GPEL0_01r3359 [Geoanaerobacter pelophilus]